MNEIILLIIVVAIFIGVQFLMKGIKMPLLSYVRISAAILLLALVWLRNENGNIGPKIILSAIGLATFIKEYFSLRKFRNSQKEFTDHSTTSPSKS
jgi:hypothetical protein